MATTTGHVTAESLGYTASSMNYSHSTGNGKTIKLYNLFEKYDVDNSGYIDENEVASLLADTYQGLGLGYAPN